MEFKSKVIRFGNSVGITIPNKIAKLIELNIGDIITINVLDDKKTIIIKK